MDALRAGRFQQLRQVALLVINAVREPELLDRVRALFIAAGNADHARTHVPRNLPGGRTDRARARRHDERVTGSGFA